MNTIAQKNRRTGILLALVALGLCIYSFSVIRHRGRLPEPAHLTPLQPGTYGVLFDTLVTCHGLHVLGGLAILGVALGKKRATRASEHRSMGEGEQDFSPTPRCTDAPLPNDWA